MTSSAIDVVKGYQEALWGDPQSETRVETASEMIADDFQLLDEDGNVVMDKATLFAMGELMAGAFDDFEYVSTDFADSGDDTVLMSGHFEGTHTRDLDLSAMGLGVIPASGKKIVWPDSTVKWTVKDDKIVRSEPAGGSTGMKGFLAPLGVEPPSG